MRMNARGGPSLLLRRFPEKSDRKWRNFKLFENLGGLPTFPLPVSLDQSSLQGFPVVVIQ